MLLNRIGRSRLLLTVFQSTTPNHIRNLYSSEELGVKKYAESRRTVEHAIANHSFFKQHFRKQLLNMEFSLTHLEYGLKNLLHIMINTQSDVSLLKDALRTWLQRRNEHQGDKYRFDTIVLRTFYFLNMPNEAVQFFEDEDLCHLFTQVTGYQILLDLLYENEKYEEVLKIYRDLNAKGHLRKNKYIDVIVLATYYRLNTPDAFEQAHELWKRMSEVGNKVQFRKSRTFIAGLALKQNRPDLALTILEGDTTYVTMRHIKLLAWAQCGQFDLVFEMLKQMIERHKENPKLKPFQSISVLNDIEKCIKLKGSLEDKQNFQRIREQIESLNLTTKQTLDDLLCAPFPMLPQANIYHKKKYYS